MERRTLGRTPRQCAVAFLEECEINSSHYDGIAFQRLAVVGLTVYVSPPRACRTYAEIIAAKAGLGDYQAQLTDKRDDDDMAKSSTNFSPTPHGTASTRMNSRHSRTRMIAKQHDSSGGEDFQRTTKTARSARPKPVFLRDGGPPQRLGDAHPRQNHGDQRHQRPDCLLRLRRRRRLRVLTPINSPSAIRPSTASLRRRRRHGQRQRSRRPAANRQLAREHAVLPCRTAQARGDRLGMFGMLGRRRRAK